ncbi:MAG: tetratricopeptide repeat protein, partial [Alphaproteobacteria bacterium]|nr:tetratricopeptide repeat protein [Alphaproteobacteria bacterium]
MNKKNDAEQNALIREVWDGVREQKVANFLKAYWKHMAIGFAVFLVMIMSVQWYHTSKVSTQLEEAALFERVLSRSALNESERDSLLQTLVSTGEYGYQGVGVLMEADKALKQGQTDKAIMFLEEGKDKVEVKELRHLIILKLALLKSDELSYDALDELISPLLDDGEPFY